MDLLPCLKTRLQNDRHCKEELHRGAALQGCSAFAGMMRVAQDSTSHRTWSFQLAGYYAGTVAQDRSRSS